MSPGTKRVLIRTAAVAAFLLWAFVYFWVTVVYVANDSDVRLTDARIVIAEQVIWEGDIRPGGFALAYGMPDRDGRVEIIYNFNGAPKEERYGYVTRGPVPTTERCRIDKAGNADCWTALRPF